MDDTMFPNEPLKFQVPVATVFFPFPIHYLSIAAVDMRERSIKRILNSLQDNSYLTISDVLNATLEDLGKARNFGKRGEALLLELLRRIADHPELILETEKLGHDLQAEVERKK